MHFENKSLKTTEKSEIIEPDITVIGMRTTKKQLYFPELPWELIKEFLIIPRDHPLKRLRQFILEHQSRYIPTHLIDTVTPILFTEGYAIRGFLPIVRHRFLPMLRKQSIYYLDIEIRLNGLFESEELQWLIKYYKMNTNVAEHTRYAGVPEEFYPDIEKHEILHGYVCRDRFDQDNDNNSTVACYCLNKLNRDSIHLYNPVLLSRLRISESYSMDDCLYSDEDLKYDCLNISCNL